MNGVEKFATTVVLSGLTALNVMPYATFAYDIAPKQQTVRENSFQLNSQTAQSFEGSSDCISEKPSSSYADGLKNLAKNKRASQSSTYQQSNFNGPPNLAVDGNTEGDFFSDGGSHTQSEKNAWWEVDLGTNYSLDKIIIWNRTDNGMGARLSNFRVLIKDNSGRVTFERTYCRGGRYFNPAMMIVLPKNINGQYVRVMLNGTNYLQLAEVEVFGLQ
ncbi:discoidin domain-containing protein [Nostoc sp.]|uniref:discoidin domain-containing protein n=1 Tax=Nostoc sp. TaxID=1180 RepID=UPI002FF98E06